MTSTIETAVWERDTEKPGYVKLAGQRPILDVYRDVVAFVRQGMNSPPTRMIGMDDIEGFDYFCVIPKRRSENWPNHVMQTMVYVTQGTNEGYRVNVAVLVQKNEEEPKFIMLMAGKTLSENIDDALRVANLITRGLGC